VALVAPVALAALVPAAVRREAARSERARSLLPRSCRPRRAAPLTIGSSGSPPVRATDAGQASHDRRSRGRSVSLHSGATPASGGATSGGSTRTCSSPARSRARPHDRAGPALRRADRVCCAERPRSAGRPSASAGVAAWSPSWWSPGSRAADPTTGGSCTRTGASSRRAAARWPASASGHWRPGLRGKKVGPACLGSRATGVPRLTVT
jgi:hypothetical protein